MASTSNSKTNNGVHCLCLLFLLSMLFLLNAHAVASSHPQLLEVQQVKRTRSLLQAPKIDCGGTCLVRCQNNWMKEMCNKMCNVCCNRCNCVPPGTGQDTRHLCPCYDTMVNPHTNKLKCP
uniref:Gibberellin regulated protein n=1 Tax=Leersia perrieri TaxID=77586 RepID=A0A0D9WUE0_9ORYZ